MELQRYWALVWKWFWLIVIGVIVAGSSSYFISRQMEPVYEATATLVIHQSASPAPGYEYSQSDVVTHAALITKQSAMEAVVNELDLPYSFKELSSKVSAHISPNTPLIELSVRDTDPGLAQEIANTTAQIYIRQYTEKLQADAQASLSLIEKQIDETSRRTTDLQSKRSDLEQLRNLRTVWSLQLAQAMSSSGISLGESASLPQSPVSPKTMQNVILACLLGLVVTTGAVSLKEYLDRSVKNADDISRLTGLAVLGIIPKFGRPRRERGRPVVEEHPRGSIAEAFRMVHTNLQFATMDKPTRTIVIVSPSPDDGKTSIVANLAVSMAQMGNKVIAVDTDLRNHHLDEYFKVPNERGFTDLLLANQPEADGFLKPTTVEGLRLLTRGARSDNTAQLLSSPRTSSVIQALGREADTVLFDSSPILAVADATILASKVDGAIVVISAGQTRPEALVEVKEALTKADVNILGVVLNGVDVSGRDSYYHYRYRNSAYYSENKEAEEKRGKAKHSSAS